MKYLKYGLGIVVGLILLIVIVVRLTIHEPRPDIIEDKNAELLAEQMLSAVNKTAWDSLSYVQWSFRGEHHYIWDKIKNDALVSWDDYEVHLDPDQVSGKAYKSGALLEGKDHDSAIQDAWSYWCNDMFWFAAPFKIRDKGVELKVARDQDGQEGLLVSYSSGGVTPGDSYLWFLGQDGLPSGFKMWVKIIPIGGVYTSWENWKKLPGGAQVASLHQGNADFLRLEITNIKGGQNWSDLGLTEGPIKL